MHEYVKKQNQSKGNLHMQYPAFQKKYNYDKYKKKPNDIRIYNRIGH